MKRFEQIDLSGDVGLRATGKDMGECFANAFTGLYDLITDTSVITPTESREIQLQAENGEDLLVRFLNELIFLYDTYNFIGKECSLEIDTKNPDMISLKARIRGDIFIPDIHESRLLIKAATYHGLSLKKVNSHWKAIIIFDI